MKQKKFNDIFSMIIAFVFVVYSLIWLYNQFFASEESITHSIFINSYGILALLGGVYGMFASKKWGGVKSLFGKSIFFLSLGLLFQEVGQLFYSYYFYVAKIEIPYPSLGDVGFFGSVLFYVLASFYIFKVSGAHFALGDGLKSKIEAKLIFIAILVFSWYFLLNGMDFSEGLTVKTFLDVGYPLFQSVYVAVAVITYRLSRFNLGGQIRKYILFLIGALVVQYFADFSYLYTIGNETYVAGGLNDFIYLTSYFLMGTAILQLDLFFDKLVSKA